MKKTILLMLLVISANCFALSIKTVMNDGQGDFDPWNTTRWASWYDSSGRLIRAFTIDCNVTFASGHNTLATAWHPQRCLNEDDHKDYSRLFFFDNTCYGVVVNGNGVYIDARPEEFRPDGYYGNETITDLYELPYLSYTRVDPLACFYSSQSLNTSKSPVTVSNLNIYGFSKAIATHANHKQKMVFDNLQIFRGSFIAHIHGGNLTLSNSQFKENFAGIYMDREATECHIINNQFRDNAYQQEYRRLYGDIQMDSASRNLIENNQYQSTAATGGPYYRCGIKFYRNKGEKDIVRLNPAGLNIIRNNSFNGYTIACDVASRQGDNGHDLAAEGRDFAYYNRFENNTFANCLFGIKINNSGNTIRGNTFNNVDYPVLLHNIFYSLTETYISKQQGTNVYHWLLNSEWYNYNFGDWHGYDLFERQAYVNGSIPESEKYLHIYSDGTANIEPYSGPARIIISETQFADAENRARDISGDQKVNMFDVNVLGRNWMRNDCNLNNSFCERADVTNDGSVSIEDLKMVKRDWLCNNDMNDVCMPAGKTPLDIAVGDFWQGNTGSEVAAVWNEKMSNIGGTDYYTVNIYDSNGVENNRCGRGDIKWTSIIAGNFVDTISSYFDEEGTTSTISCPGDEIAAVSSVPDANGFYPIYILSPCRKKPLATLLPTNPTPVKAMAAGDFVTGDSLDELAVILTGGTSIKIYKPATDAYVSQITVASNIRDIVGGNFHQSYIGDEIAGIDNSSSLIYFYRVSKGTGYWTTAGVTGGSAWAKITAGEFYSGAYSRQEVAVLSSAASNGIFKIYSYEISGTVPIKEIVQDVLAVSPAAMDAGTFPIAPALGLYERVQGFYSSNYTAAMSGWGYNVAVLPSAPQMTATPVFWLNSAPSDNAKQYLKVTPLTR